jgi:hypothetical protein
MRALQELRPWTCASVSWGPQKLVHALPWRPHLQSFLVCLHLRLRMRACREGVCERWPCRHNHKLTPGVVVWQHRFTPSGAPRAECRAPEVEQPIPQRTARHEALCPFAHLTPLSTTAIACVGE